MEQYKNLALDKIHKTNDCWIWQGAPSKQGYGRITFLAHRFVYEILKEAIPPELHLDHLCKNRLCVNPDHLEPVTNTINSLRGDSLRAREARQTHCKYGHPFDLLNTAYTKEGKRRCRKCNIRTVMQVLARNLARDPEGTRAKLAARARAYRAKIRFQRKDTSADRRLIPATHGL